MLVPNVDDNLVRVVMTYAKQYAHKENNVSKPSKSPIYKNWTYPLVKIYILSIGYISSTKKNIVMPVKQQYQLNGVYHVCARV